MLSTIKLKSDHKSREFQDVIRDVPPEIEVPHLRGLECKFE